MPPEAASPVIEFREVSYRVAGTQVLSGFNLQVESGETLVLLGRSGSGKTTSLKLVNRLLSPTSGEIRVKGVPNTEADLIRLRRSIGEKHPPTLLVDEADTLFGSKRVAEQNEDLRALLNAGHQRGRPALRCVGPNQTPTKFSTFAMAALAGIGSMPDTITDRAVNVTLRRRTREESQPVSDPARRPAVEDSARPFGDVVR